MPLAGLKVPTWEATDLTGWVKAEWAKVNAAAGAFISMADALCAASCFIRLLFFFSGGIASSTVAISWMDTRRTGLPAAFPS